MLAGSPPAAARTPAPPPILPHCKARCDADDLACVERCRSGWQAGRWRERLQTASPPASSCLAGEAACRARCDRPGSGARCRASCQRRLEPCVWRALGLQPAAMQRCWAARARQTRRCADPEGNIGWACRQDVRQVFYGCARRAAPRLAQDALRIALELDEEMVTEGYRY